MPAFEEDDAMLARALRSAALIVGVTFAVAEQAPARPQAGKPPPSKPGEKPADPHAAPAAAPAPTTAGDDAPVVHDLAELTKTITAKQVVSALGWLEFMGAGYKGAADHLGQGDAADAELALGGAVEKSVQALLPTLVGKKVKVKLSDTIDAPILRVSDDGFVVSAGKNEEKAVGWRDVDPVKLAILLLHAKPTTDAELAAISMLRLLGGDAADAKRNATKLGSEFGKKLGEIVESFRSVGPELKAARALDSILREKDDLAFLERTKKAWPETKESALAKEIAPKLREQFLVRGTSGYAGEPGIKAAIHGHWKVDPKKPHPMAGAGALWFEVEYEFDKDSEATDFDAALAPKTLRQALDRVEGKHKDPQPFLADRSRLTNDGPALGSYPLTFLGNFEMNVVGGLEETPKSHSLGEVVFGAIGDDGSREVVVENFFKLVAYGDDRAKPAGSTMFKDDKVKPGDQFDTLLRVGGNKISTTRNGESNDPVDCPTDRALRPFLIATSDSQWFIERLTIRGTVPAAALRTLGRQLAEKEAVPLFGEG